MKQMHLVTAQVAANVSFAEGIYCMTLESREIAHTAKPGQFVMVYLNKGEMLLPRPISICAANPSLGTIDLVYQVVGKGTKVMSEIKPFLGHEIKLLGPLGNGYKLEKFLQAESPQNVAVVGGGIGVPPLLFLAKTLAERGINVDAYLGFRNDPILIYPFQKAAKKLFVTTEDGSFGQRGYVTDILTSRNKKYDQIFACGPLPLLRVLADYSKSVSIPCQVSVEQRMACGVGTCVGCVVKVGGKYVRVCTEGPVFYADEPTWGCE